MSRHRQADQQGGFSLLEILITLAIAGIALSLLFTSLSTWRERIAINAFERALAQGMGEARLSSLVLKRPILISDCDGVAALIERGGTGAQVPLSCETLTGQILIGDGRCTGSPVIARLTVLIQNTRRDYQLADFCGRGAVHHDGP